MTVEVWSEPSTATEGERQGPFLKATYPSWDAMLAGVPKSEQLRPEPVMGTEFTRAAKMSDPSDPARLIMAYQR